MASNHFCKTLCNTVVCGTVKIPQEGILAPDSSKAELANNSEPEELGVLICSIQRTL